MQLSDREIYAAISKGEIVFGCPEPSHPFDLARQVQPASVDLRLGNRVLRFSRNVKTFDIRDLECVNDFLDAQYLDEGTPIAVGPQEIVFGQVYEQISVCDKYSARVEGRSRLARLGISVHCTGDYINPGFAGAMPLQIVNHNAFEVTLYPYISVCQLLIYQLTSQPLVSYSERSVLPSNRYYGETDAGPSILHLDKELRHELDNGTVVQTKIARLVENYMRTAERDRDREVGCPLQSFPSISVSISNVQEGTCMRDQYNAAQVGNQGPNSGSNSQMILMQSWGDNAKRNELIEELGALRDRLKQGEGGDNGDIVIGKVAEAQQSAREGNLGKLLSALKGAGQQALDVAMKAGLDLAAKYLQSAIGG